MLALRPVPESIEIEGREYLAILVSTAPVSIGGGPQAITGKKLDAITAALDGGMSKAAVCRNFGIKRTTLIETLARVGWRGTGRTVNEQQK